MQSATMSKYFHAEFELNNEEDIIGVQPFAVSGTNPIDQDASDHRKRSGAVDGI